MVVGGATVGRLDRQRVPQSVRGRSLASGGVLVAVAYLGFVRGCFGPEGVPSSVLRCVRVGAGDVQAGEWALRVAWVVTLLADRTDGGADDI